MVTIRKVLDKLKRGKSLIFAGIILAIAGTILSVLALWQSENIFPNLFKAADYKTTVVEEFQSPNDWKPGDETEKKVTVKNEGSICVRARASYTEEWTDKDGNELPLEKNGQRIAIINFDNTDDWVKQDGYYYYQKDLLKNQTSSSFIKSVTYNKELSSDYVCTTEGNIQKCTMSNGAYDGAEYTLTITIEMIQCDGIEDLWPESLTYSTVLYSDGTLIINEPETKRTSNTTKHGDIIKEYEPFGENNVYYFEDMESQLWYPERQLIKSVEVGQQISPLSTNYWFAGAIKMEKGDFTNLDTSKVGSMAGMFAEAGTSASKFQLKGLEDWNTSKVGSMAGMFAEAGSYSQSTEIGDLSNWDTSNVTSMEGMFYRTGMNSGPYSIGDLSNWDTSKVSSMTSMFEGAAGLTDIGTLNVYSANISKMFNVSARLKGVINIHSLPSSYSNTFAYCAIESGSGVTVNYSSATTNIDNIIATKSADSNVVKGTLITE